MKGATLTELRGTNQITVSQSRTAVEGGSVAVDQQHS